MMEDPDTNPEAEWSIQEYSSKENNGKLRWMLNKGLTVGRKILVTGFVISSAPIVLPPLAVVSIIGFACSVPCGLFLASYACTNKLMSKLLPETKPPRYLLEYGTVSSTDGGVESDANIDREEEEEFMLEDTRKIIEMGIELGEKDRSDEYGQGGFRNDERELGSNVNEIVEEIELKIEGVGEEEEKQPAVNEVGTVVVDVKREEKSGRAVEGTGTEFKVTSVVVDFGQDADIEEYKEIEGETNRLLEKIREEGMVDNGEEQKQIVEKPNGGAEEGDLRVGSHSEEMGMPFEGRSNYANVEREKPLREIEKKIEENQDDETPKDSLEKPEMGNGQNVDAIPKETEPKPAMGDLLATQESDEVLEAEKSTSEMSGTTDVGGSIAEEQQKPIVSNDNITKDAQQDSQLNGEKEIVISTNADFNTVEDVASTKNEQSSSNAVLESADLKVLPVKSGEHDRNDTGISSQKDIGMASSKQVYLTEEKILEKIEAMRAIVGYKTARQATCLEELKALYVFTGVEPSASFKDPSDLVEVNDKLRFLMSIIGVK